MQRKFRTDIDFLNEQKQKLNVQLLIDALTDPDKVLNFPIKYPAIELDKASKQALYLTAGIISLGLILSATIKSK